MNSRLFKWCICTFHSVPENETGFPKIPHVSQDTEFTQVPNRIPGEFSSLLPARWSCLGGEILDLTFGRVRTLPKLCTEQELFDFLKETWISHCSSTLKGAPALAQSPGQGRFAAGHKEKSWIFLHPLKSVPAALRSPSHITHPSIKHFREWIWETKCKYSPTLAVTVTGLDLLLLCSSSLWGVSSLPSSQDWHRHIFGGRCQEMSGLTISQNYICNLQEEEINHTQRNTWPLKLSMTKTWWPFLSNWRGIL